MLLVLHTPIYFVCSWKAICLSIALRWFGIGVEVDLMKISYILFCKYAGWIMGLRSDYTLSC